MYGRLLRNQEVQILIPQDRNDQLRQFFTGCREKWRHPCRMCGAAKTFSIHSGYDCPSSGRVPPHSCLQITANWPRRHNLLVNFHNFSRLTQVAWLRWNLNNNFLCSPNTDPTRFRAVSETCCLVERHPNSYTQKSKLKLFHQQPLELLNWNKRSERKSGLRGGAVNSHPVSERTWFRSLVVIT